MILYPPQKFDWNEWFITIIWIVNIVLFLSLPKKFPASITILLLLFGMTQAKMSDFIFDLLFNLYYINDSTKYEWFDLLLIGIYPPFSYYYIYIYQTLNFKGISLFIYIVLVGLFSICIEYFAFLAHVYNYTDWKLLYSFPVYLITLSCTLLFYHLITVIMERTHQQMRRDLS
jgi:hypothetical protein